MAPAEQLTNFYYSNNNVCEQLIKLENFEKNLPRIVEDLVLDKFCDKINNFADRKYRRTIRKSKKYISDKNDDTHHKDKSLSSSIDSNLHFNQQTAFFNEKAISCTLSRTNNYVHRRFPGFLKRYEKNIDLARSLLLSAKSDLGLDQKIHIFNRNYMKKVASNLSVDNIKMPDGGNMFNGIKEININIINKSHSKISFFNDRSRSYQSIDADSKSVNTFNISIAISRGCSSNGTINRSHQHHHVSVPNIVTESETSTPVDTPETVTPAESEKSASSTARTKTAAPAESSEPTATVSDDPKRTISSSNVSKQSTGFVGCLKAADNSNRSELRAASNNSRNSSSEILRNCDKSPVKNNRSKTVLMCENVKSSDAISGELEKLNEIISQLSQAVVYCRNTKFATTSYRLEAEKLLLSALCKRELLCYEAKHNINNEMPANNFVSGTVVIKDLIFIPKNYDLPPSRHKTSQDKRCYVCLLNYNTQIQETEIIKPDENGVVHFKNEFIFSKLQPSFKIAIALFSMNLSKKHLKGKANKSCLINNKCCCDNNNYCLEEFSMFPSTFGFCGRTTITLSHLNEENTYSLYNTPILSHLSTFKATINAAIDLHETRRGFLTISKYNDNYSPSWTRQWCVLHGSLFSCYNYPSDEGIKSPVNIINLKESVNNEIEPVNKELCPRPRTLLIEILNGDDEVVKYLIFADSREDYISWKSSFEFVMSNLVEWKCF